MEKLNLMKIGVLRLPPGFRFHPTDEELVVQYLKRKVLSCPLPAFIIPEVDVCKSDPWDLPGDGEQERYFFSTREVKYPNGKWSNRATGSGYWKATGLDKQIVSSNKQRHQNIVIVGMKKTLVFYRGKPPKGSRTDWVMHEYRLTSPQNNTNNLVQENWVLCRIFSKRRNKINNNKSDDDEVGGGPVPVPANASSSTASSGITTTDISNTNIAGSDDEDHEQTSSCNSFFRQRTNVYVLK